MKVKIQFFGHTAELAGCESYVVKSESGSKVVDIMQIVESKFSLLKKVKPIKIAVNTKYVSRDAPVDDGDTISYIPPVGGG